MTIVDIDIDSDDDRPVTLCLNMIVKNESRIIRRLLSSVVGIIDSYCICDTGSTDNTVDIICDFFSPDGPGAGIEGKICSEPFKNFAYNRSWALEQCLGMSDFVLFLDADMVLRVGLTFDKQRILRPVGQGGDAFMMMQGQDGGLLYENVRIVRNQPEYSYSGVTHEYINRPADCKLEILPRSALFIEDIGDGGAKADKAERDIRLLEQGLIDEPQLTDRYLFYLANTYLDNGRNEEAIAMYDRRLAMGGGWDQELWHCCFKKGTAYQRLGKMGDAVNAWLDAYDYCPLRIENIYEIVKYKRESGKNKTAMSFYELANGKLAIANTQIHTFLFYDESVALYKLAYEYTILAAYVGRTDICKEVITVLNHEPQGFMVDNVLRNLKFYQDPIANKASRCVDFSATEGYMVSSSASLLPNEGQYIMNQRFVNYRIKPDGTYTDCDKNITTFNKCIHLDHDLSPIGTGHMFYAMNDGRLYLGVEDVKLITRPERGKEAVSFIGTNFHKSDNRIGMVVGEYDVTKETLVGREITAPFNADAGCEKNWVYAGETNIIYKWSPLTVCHLDADKGELVKDRETNLECKMLDRVRGSTCGSFYNGEWWFVGHIVSHESPRHYYHVFMVLDAELTQLKRYSAPFTFEGEPIEYCLGLIVEHDRVLVTYSAWDRSTKILVFDPATVAALACFGGN
jgi:glycosyltransferase involved in cell wall biosynthesis